MEEKKVDIDKLIEDIQNFTSQSQENETLEFSMAMDFEKYGDLTKAIQEVVCCLDKKEFHYHLCSLALEGMQSFVQKITMKGGFKHLVEEMKIIDFQNLCIFATVCFGSKIQGFRQDFREKGKGENDNK